MCCRRRSLRPPARYREEEAMLNRRALAPWRLVVLMALALIAPLFVANLAYADPTAAPGWAVAPLITGFTTSTPCPNSDCYGPVGSAFSPSGDLWVEDYPSGYIYRWDAGTLPQAPATTSVSAANFSANNSPSGDGVFALAFGGDGRLWATYTSFSTSKVVQLGTSGANAGLIIQTLTNESSKANRLNGIAVDPLSGDIFVSVVSSP